MQEYEKIYDFQNLYNSYKKARKGKRWKEAAVKFEANLMEAILLLQRQLKTKTYTLSEYNVFKVYEPKERLVMSNSYKDKVVQHSICDNVLEPTLTKTFIELGIDELSVSPSCVLPIRKNIREIRLKK